MIIGPSGTNGCETLSCNAARTGFGAFWPPVVCAGRSASSRDLVKWENARSLRLMQGIRDEAGRLARNIWAPEWFLDPATVDTVLLWSSSFEDAGWKRSRLWFARTRDWQTFTRLLTAP